MEQKGFIIKSISGEYTVFGEDGSMIACKPRGIFRHIETSPKVGDNVSYIKEERIITTIHPRKNDLVRPVIANVDQIFLLFSLKAPELNLHLLDRMISIFEYEDIDIIIVLTKKDLIPYEEIEPIVKYYQKIGYPVILTSKAEPQNEYILRSIEGKISVFTGQSGVGKSTLLNHLDPELKIKTAEISIALGRGKHTTRHVELLPLGSGWIADTPGFGLIDFFDMDVQTLSHTFVEFFEHSHLCKFHGCTHMNEPDCAIKDLVRLEKILPSRYKNYIDFAQEIEEKRKFRY